MDVRQARKDDATFSTTYKIVTHYLDKGLNLNFYSLCRIQNSGWIILLYI
jgi:hypothetical protein